MIAVIVNTRNRAELLRSCVERVIGRTSPLTTEVAIWDNGSTDATAEYLRTLDDPRIHTLRTERNVGMNGYAFGFRSTSAPFVIELDDDVVDAPDGWDRRLLDAYRQLPTIGFLAADVVDDPHDTVAEYRYRIRPHEYRPYELAGIDLLTGPVGGYCAMISRELADQVEAFGERPGLIHWEEDTYIVESLARLGLESAVLPSLRVHHTGGPHYCFQAEEKLAYWDAYFRRRTRRQRVKTLVHRIPFVAVANRRMGWYEPPSEGTKAPRPSSSSRAT